MAETPKPMGYWFKHIDKTLEDNFVALLATEGLQRRHWQITHTLSGGPLDAPALDVALSPFLNAQDPTAAPYVGVLIARGWVEVDDAGTYALTPEGVDAHAKLFERIQIQRRAATEGLTDDDYRTLMVLLQRVSANVDAFARTLR
ncbi:MarR family winged helix-turn-helix transcriptional regulator [Nocardia sp. CDC153]|uniref:MarR family winged helix-turn-helix transcriptional regulator n=1 Tax=Nocardia sp. CDC153 TaxID=3112167 RepID=UPI002DBC9244|nr:MarR family winged helix-turn-helix transcriptional regulator [Nocardia sp. CDC153]MEC3954666.1 MarR family winged helix-turn-helix transcriptional regulator [Nocardia sp. CDC153]